MTFCSMNCYTSFSSTRQITRKPPSMESSVVENNSLLASTLSVPPLKGQFCCLHKHLILVLGYRQTVPHLCCINLIPVKIIFIKPVYLLLQDGCDNLVHLNLSAVLTKSNLSLHECESISRVDVHSTVQHVFRVATSSVMPAVQQCRARLDSMDVQVNQALR